MAFTSYEVDNDKSFQRAIDRASKTVDDLRVPFALILLDFHQSQKAIFKLRGPGQYPDLSPKYKIAKQKAVGFIYPILKRTGALEKSTTTPNSEGSIAQISKKKLTIGTSLPYGVFHQSDAPRDKIPLRKFLFIGPEAKRFAIKKTAGRTERWLNIMNSFVLKSLEKQGFDVKGVVPDPKSIPVRG